MKQSGSIFSKVWLWERCWFCRLQTSRILQVMTIPKPFPHRHGEPFLGHMLQPCCSSWLLWPFVSCLSEGPRCSKRPQKGCKNSRDVQNHFKTVVLCCVFWYTYDPKGVCYPVFAGWWSWGIWRFSLASSRPQKCQASSLGVSGILGRGAAILTNSWLEWLDPDWVDVFDIKSEDFPASHVSLPPGLFHF